MTQNILSYFDNHPAVEVFYFTSDHLAFFKEHDALNHSRHLADKNIMTISRIDAGNAMGDLEQLQDVELRALAQEESKQTMPYDLLDAE